MAEHYKDAALAAPPLGVGTLTFLGVTLNELVLIGTLIYTVFLLIDKAPAVFRNIRDMVRYLRNRT